MTAIRTSTAAPPIRLTQKYPDTLKTLQNGQKATHRARPVLVHQPRYRQFCRRLPERDLHGLEPDPLGTPGNNPGLMLELRRFMTAMYRGYQRNEVEAIRAHARPRRFVTSHFMERSDAFDHYALSEDLDFASWDNYVSRGPWVMEPQPGSSTGRL